MHKYKLLPLYDVTCGCVFRTDQLGLDNGLCALPRGRSPRGNDPLGINLRPEQSCHRHPGGTVGVQSQVTAPKFSSHRGISCIPEVGEGRCRCLTHSCPTWSSAGRQSSHLRRQHLLPLMLRLLPYIPLRAQQTLSATLCCLC